MLIESLVWQTLGVKDHRVVKVDHEQEQLLIFLKRKRLHRLPCSQCGQRAHPHDALQERRWRHVPLWGIPSKIVYQPWRVRCPQCGIKVERIPWGPSKSPLSLPLVIVLATWAKLLALKLVAEMFSVSWSTVAGAVKQAVNYGLEHRETDFVLGLGIDEISRQKGHIYHTQIYDLTEHRLLWSQEGRSAETLEAFFKEWGPERTQRIVGICCDMWAPYVQVIRRYAPQAVLVFDKFHLIRHLLEAVNRVRKQEARQQEKINPDLLRGAKYIFLKNPWNLTPRQKERLGFLEKMNLKINRAYLLKESFRQLWDYHDIDEAKCFLKKWFWLATHSRLRPMRDFAWLLRRHEENILTYFDLPIDNGAVEAMNNNAKVISHRAHGFRTGKWFSTIMLHGMGNLPMPTFVHRFS